ncbi:PDR/VanB family oxidoreductase [Celeribacter indicus]|uniref:Ferredoxin:oxidoreductase FAD/NAD(P)-binding subunit n=1 Tax=Celeribacter indicus TaxID=1208324 RepID=A0A0B5DX42_9RHOB|nr:PDR/VanB family oxidoreductase [Celeribacter indicus]AJE47589.1 ferredoxin:oxidoreductase FAD/NAD(P)-binding subunit [Celeribacter indicus]SDW11151.1 vanillate O-demethylase ferredoxin subunit [Celeribacter indicus]
MTKAFVIPPTETPAGPEQMEMRVHAIRWLAPAVREIELRATDGTDCLPGLAPGGHVDLSLPGGLTRSYSLTNGPDCTDCYRVAVHRAPDSAGGSAWLCETLRVGDTLGVSPARNTFEMAPGGAPSAFIAGGIGITPILSMLRHLEVRGGDWTLLYAARSREDAAFLPEIAALDAGRGRVTLHFDDAAGGAHPDLAAWLAAVPREAHLYACGPAPMLDAYETAAAGFPDDQVHLERFAGEADISGGGFTVELRRSGREFFIPEGKSIMEVLRAEGVRVAYSCQSGVCGTCETRVLEGVPDHRDMILSDRERESGKTMLICCSRALSERLVLDL